MVLSARSDRRVVVPTVCGMMTVMVDATPDAPETTELAQLVTWLRAVAPIPVADEVIAESLAEGLYYEAQATLTQPDADPDFFADAASRQRGEVAVDWAQRSLKGLVMNIGQERGAQAASRGARRAAGLLAKAP